jgi:hypothetical protein
VRLKRSTPPIILQRRSRCGRTDIDIVDYRLSNTPFYTTSVACILCYRRTTFKANIIPGVMAKSSNDIRYLIYNWRSVVFVGSERNPRRWVTTFTVSATTSSDYLLFPLYMTLPSSTFSCSGFGSGVGSGVLDDEMRIGGTRGTEGFLWASMIYVLTLWHGLEGQ